MRESDKKILSARRDISSCRGHRYVRGSSEVPADNSCSTGEEQSSRKRRTFRWPKEARDLVRTHLSAQRAQTGTQDPAVVQILVTRLMEVSGNPRDACWRFARQAGI